MVFDKYWFIKHQSKLLWLIHNPVGNLVFRYKKFGCKADRHLIIKITPNSIAEFLGYKDGQIKLKEHFFGRNEYARSLYFYLYSLWLLMHFWDWLIADRFIPQLSFNFATLTVNPNANPETTSVDGFIGNSGNALWATVHDAITGNDAQPSATTGAIQVEASAADWNINRGFFLFNTSALTSSAVISSAVLRIYVSAKDNGDNDGDDWMNVIQSSPASNTDLTTADFDQCGAISNPTEGATRIDIGSITTAAYNEWTLDATGLTWVSKTSITKLGVREGHDALNSQLSGVPVVRNGITVNFADNAANKPELVVTYTLPSTAKFLSLLGAGT